MPSFGEKLKQEREKRKITLEQISASTKIGTRMLQALEEDKFNQLPGGIFNKGFVRAYSRFLGLDEDQTVAEYLQASGDAPPVSTEIAAREDGARENEENISRLEAISDAHPRQLPWGLFAALLLLVALALSLWSHRQREHAREALHPTPTTPVMPPPGGQSSTEASGKISNETNASSSPTNGSTTDSAPTGGSSSAPKAAQNEAVSVPASTPGEFTVVIQAREESWISVTTDGKTAPSEVLAAGSERSVHGRKQITIKAGNAGGLDFRFNGKKLAIGGESGEVKIVTFGPAGLLASSTGIATHATDAIDIQRSKGEKRMVSPQLWLEVLAWVKTLFESTKATIDLRSTYEKYQRDRATIQESRRISVEFTTYSEEEVESLLHRLEGCRDRFIAQGGGAERAQCICSVLHEASKGNGGRLPLIDDWQNIFSQLGCSRNL